MEIKTTEVLKINAKTLKVHLKVSDSFVAILESATGTQIFDQDDGYVPDFMPGEHFGDYVILNIDIDTGLITNWIAPSARQIQDWIKGED